MAGARSRSYHRIQPMQNVRTTLWITAMVAMTACGNASTWVPPASPTEPATAGCPTGTESMQGQCVRKTKAPKLANTGATTTAIANTREIASPTETPAPSEPVADPLPDSRPSRLRPRVRALLIVEIQGLEKLYSVSPASSTDRPLLVRRLAEDYGELEAAASLDMTRPQPNQSQAAIDNARRVRDASRKNVVKYYKLLLDNHPTYEKLDEVYYYLAVELALIGDSAGRRSALDALLQKFPDSKHAEDAREAIGP